MIPNLHGNTTNYKREIEIYKTLNKNSDKESKMTEKLERIVESKLVESARNKDIVGVKDSFKKLISPMVTKAISERKLEVAKRVFNQE